MRVLGGGGGALGSSGFLRMVALVFFSLVSASCGDSGKRIPEVLALPPGFRPEGVTLSGDALLVGSIPTGRVFEIDVRTGLGRMLVDDRGGRSAIGMKVDSEARLFVAGGATGEAYVYDARTGADLARYALEVPGNTFINDVVLTPQAAWFTDSRNAVLHRVALNPDGSPTSQAMPVPLTGAFQLVPGQTNANGIAATEDGNTLLVVQTNTGRLFTVEAGTGVARRVDLGGESLPNADGVLLEDRKLYVVQNRSNQLAVISLALDLASGVISQRVTSELFDVPTTVAANDRSLYVVNARFGIGDPDAAEYSVVRIEKP
jgi:sugar lactone lactonase YvrE